jgi:serine/threonine protein kinase
MTYRAPEQLLFKPYDGSVDMWSLALVLFELYTGFPLLEVEGSEREGQTIVDFLHLLTHNVGPLTAEFVQSVPPDYCHFLNADGSIAHPLSEAGEKGLEYFTKIAESNPGIAVWEACIQKVARKKQDNPAHVGKLIAFLKPMLRYHGRITPDEALRAFNTTN